MVEEAYVSFETAKLLKEKGFNEECFALYNPDGVLIQSGIRLNNIQVGRVKGSYAAPTLQMACKWLREVHNICITIYPNKEKGYEAVLYDIKDNVEIVLQSLGVYGTHIFGDYYEEVVEAAILYSLENLI
jgi:hypothetical protein